MLHWRENMFVIRNLSLIRTIVIFFLLIMLVSIACNLPNYKLPDTDPGKVLTQVAINVVTNLTMTAAAAAPQPTSNQPPPTWTLIDNENPNETPFPPSATGIIPTGLSTNLSVTDATRSLGPEAILSLTPSSFPVTCIYRANLEYTNTSDGDLYTLNKEFTKVWRLKNTGSCDWTISYEFFFVRGDLLGAKVASPLAKDVVPPNGYADVKIKMKAPNKPGIYTGYWMIRGDGHVFGIGPKGNDPLWIKIEAYKKKP
jgi:hypothetical protein